MNGLEEVREVGDIHKSDDVECKLEENGEQDIEIEDISERSFPGQFLDGL